MIIGKGGRHPSGFRRRRTGPKRRAEYTDLMLEHDAHSALPKAHRRERLRLAAQQGSRPHHRWILRGNRIRGSSLKRAAKIEKTARNDKVARNDAPASRHSARSRQAQAQNPFQATSGHASRHAESQAWSKITCHLNRRQRPAILARHLDCTERSPARRRHELSPCARNDKVGPTDPGTHDPGTHNPGANGHCVHREILLR